MNPRIVIFGSAGQLGTDLAEMFRLDGHFDTIPLKYEQADCTDAAAVRRVLVDMRPDVVINSAAYVRVDDCEARAEKAFRVNSIGALNIARACAEIDALCVYISTDYVFNGEKTLSYVESDPPQPINVYGASKLAGELLVRQTASHWLIIRSASLFGKTGARGKDGNFIESILAKAQVGQPLSVVNDVRMSPTYTRDAAAALVELIQVSAEGIVHLANKGACSWYEFAIRALELTGIQATIAPVLAQQYPTRARRPMNSALQSERFLVKLRPWQDALEAYLAEKGHIKNGLSRACE